MSIPQDLHNMMRAATSHALPASTGPSARYPSISTIWHAISIFLLLTVGTLGLLYDSAAVPNSERVTRLHLAFGVVLMVSVAARGYWGSNSCSLIRRTSRLIYLLLYVLVGLQIALDIADRSPGALTHLHTEHCLAYLGYGAAAQLMLRVFANFPRRP
jgi:hypothetical protein